MIQHRASPNVEPDESDTGRPSPRRQFAQLVGASETRRVALPRLLLATGMLVGLFVLVVFAGYKVIWSLSGWVASQPDQKLQFSRIELVPSPPPWVDGGAPRILEQVQIEAKNAETLSLLDLDLKQLEKDFRLCHWVKDVVLIERSHGRLSVQLRYRRPVAIVVLKNEIAHVIDEEGVPLPDSEIEWISKKSPFRVRGISGTLIQIRGVESSTPPRYGVPWLRAGGKDPYQDRDPMVLRAARLAEFLQRQSPLTPSGRKAPNFVSIHLPDEPINTFFLCDSQQNWLNWGKAPGDEKASELSAEERWKMLEDWIERHGQLQARNPNYLQFTRDGVRFVAGKPRSRKSTGPP